METHWSNQVILNRFRVDLRLPGAGENYRAWDTLTSQAVALHLLPDLLDDETRRQQELRDQELAHFSHPIINPYLGVFENAGRSFWVEGYLDAPTLRDILTSIPGQPLDLTETLIYLKSLSAALDALHSAGWAHANLCPENIRVTRTGRVRLFGLFHARLLGEIPPVTTRYTPADKALSPAYDVFSLARITVEMLAGSLPDPLPDLRTRNPLVPEYFVRQLPRALDAYQSSRINNASEFFLTSCLACRVDAAQVPDRIPLDSASAFQLGVWEFLPAVQPPPAIALKSPRQEHTAIANRPPWFWALLAGGLLVLMLGAWLLPGLLSGASAGPTPTGGTQAITSVTQPPVQPVSGQADGTTAPIATGPQPLSGRIVFTCTRGGMNQLCMIEPTGGQISRLTAETAQDYYPVLSPAGDYLAYASNRGGTFGLYLKEFASDTETRLSDGTGEVAASSFSRDGARLLYSYSKDGRPFELWQVSRTGGDASLLFSGGGSIASASWSPNGRSIALAMSSPTDLTAFEIYIFDLETRTLAPLSAGALSGLGGSVDWSPDGRSIAVFAGPPGDKDIYLVDVVSGQTTQLTSGGNNASPAFSPDGGWIVFNSLRNGNADLYIMRSDGSDLRQLTSDPDPDWQPRWSR